MNQYLNFKRLYYKVVKRVETLLDTACGLVRNLNTVKIVGGIKATKSWGWQV